MPFFWRGAIGEFFFNYVLRLTLPPLQLKITSTSTGSAHACTSVMPSGVFCRILRAHCLACGLVGGYEDFPHCKELQHHEKVFFVCLAACSVRVCLVLMLVVLARG